VPDVYLCAALAPYNRDDPRYWETGKPADHNVAGFFADGPQPATPPMNKQAAPGRWHQVGKLQEAAPHAPRERRAQALTRQRAAAYHRLLTAVRRAA
jgi:hypothetical protein